MSLRILCATTLLASALVLPAASARAAGDEDHSILVEITEHAKGPPTSVAMTLTLVGDSCASAESQQDRDHERYRVAVCPFRNGALSFEISREWTGRQTTSSQKMKMTARLAPDKRVVIGKISHPDGSYTELAVTLTKL